MNKGKSIALIVALAAATCAGGPHASATPQHISAWSLYEDSQSMTCANGACDLYFHPVLGTVGTDSVEITNVTCNIAIAGGNGGVTGLQLGQGSQTGKTFTGGPYLAPITYLSFYNPSTSQMSANTLYVVDTSAGTAAYSPVIALAYYPASATATLACTIAGPYK
jgi:hypothetical protein